MLRSAMPVAVALVFAIGAGAASAASKAPTCRSYDTFRTGAAPSVHYMPPQVAANEGLLKRYCIKLDLTPIASPALLLAQVSAGRADFAMLDASTVVGAMQQGIKLKIITPNTGTGAAALCTASDGGVRSLKELEGKSVATPALNSNVDIATRVLLSRSGVDLNKVKFVQVGSASLGSAIANGTVDAGQCSEPTWTINASRMRVLNEDPLATVFGKKTPFTYGVVSEDFYRQHRDVVVRYQRAYLAAARLVARNPAALRRALRFGLSLTPDVASRMHLPIMPLDYGYDRMVPQVKAVARFGGIKPATEAQLKSLFAPLPKS